MSKIIIHNRSKLNDYEAMMCVVQVVKEGKCSKTSKGEQYCFVTRFPINKVTIVADKVKDKETHTFYVTGGEK